jgi:hypothetical protein
VSTEDVILLVCVMALVLVLVLYFARGRGGPPADGGGSVFDLALFWWIASDSDGCAA